MAATASRSFGHFEVVTGSDGWPVKLGRGAMGTTYRARDTVLQAEVALKVIGVNVAGHPAARAAFLREARAAAQLRHPNVASVFHYGEQEGECFYAMELVEGETLEARLRRDGPLPPTLVLDVGRQVARALMEAEALGMVHRDLKPSNIMFAAGRSDAAKDLVHIKVIDFGLAQAVEVAEAQDGTAAKVHRGFVGTPSFASPEQFGSRGGGLVDTRSDIYSLGVTLWYLLCGKLPFGGATLDAIHEQQVGAALPVEQLIAAKVPAAVIALLQSMLKASPSERPPSAGALLEALEKCQRQLSPTRRSTVSWVPLIAAVVLLLGGIVVTSLLSTRSHKARFASAQGVAVLPFENLNPNKAEAFYTTGVQDEIISALGHIGDLTVIGPESTKNYPPGSRDLARISRDLGVDHLVEGSVLREPDHVRIAVKLIDPHDTARTWAKQYDSTLAEAVALQSRITHDLASQLRTKLSPGVSAAIAEPPTISPAAYDLYLRAMAKDGVVATAEEFRRRGNECLDLLHHAVQLDSKFVLAYCEMATLHDALAVSSDLIPEERAVDHRSLAEAALETARRLKPDDGTVHKALAWHLFLVAKNNDQARLEADLARATMPNDSGLENLEGKIARAQGRWEDAARALEKASVLDPRDETNFKALAEVYRCLRRYPEADRAYAGALAAASPAVAPYYRLHRASVALDERADLVPLRAALTDLATGNKDDAGKFSVQFQVMTALFSRDPAALSHTIVSLRQPSEPLGAQNIVANGWAFPKAWFEGVAARLRGDEDAARLAFTAARTELEKTLAADARKVEALSLLAVIDAGLGRKADAVREGLRAREILRENPSALKLPVVECRLAAVYAWTDQPDEAFRLLDTLTRNPAGPALYYQPTYGELQLDPVWDPLRHDPRFAPLVARLAPKNPR